MRIVIKKSETVIKTSGCTYLLHPYNFSVESNVHANIHSLAFSRIRMHRARRERRDTTTSSVHNKENLWGTGAR